MVGLGRERYILEVNSYIRIVVYKTHGIGILIQRIYIDGGWLESLKNPISCVISCLCRFPVGMMGSSADLG